MTELKTLNELSKSSRDCCSPVDIGLNVCEECVKQEAIKWIKVTRQPYSDRKLEINWQDDCVVMGYDRAEWDDEYLLGYIIGRLAMIAHFFNITEEELK